MTKDIDKKIKELRKKTRQADGVEECYFYFTELNKLQRSRFEATGKFLPHSDGFVHVYLEEDDLWLAWKKNG